MTDRDMKIINFINKCPCYSNSIQKIFFPGKSQRMANKRLKYLFDYGHVKRTRENTWESYFYYINRKPKQLIHYDYIARSFHWIMQQGYIINEFEVQKRYEKIIPDLIVDISKDGKRGLLPVEVELNLYNLDHKIKQYENSEFNKLLLFSNSTRQSNIINIINAKIEDL
jgi:hypothetical protein